LEAVELVIIVLFCDDPTVGDDVVVAVVFEFGCNWMPTSSLEEDDVVVVEDEELLDVEDDDDDVRVLASDEDVDDELEEEVREIVEELEYEVVNRMLACA